MLTPNQNVEHVSYTGDEINLVLDRIQPAVSGFPEPLMVIACLAVVITAQYPQITSDQLDKAILDTSDFIANYLDTLDPTTSFGKAN